MPQGKERKAQYQRDFRARQKGTSSVGTSTEGLQTKDGTYFKDGVEMVPAEGTLPERPRYLQLTDGQILDRANQPSPNKHLLGMIACNRANDYRNTMSRQRRLGRLLIALDKEVTGLDGKRLNLLTTVRWGVAGPTLKEIKDAIK